jgi:hypothetical protein
MGAKQLREFRMSADARSHKAHLNFVTKVGAMGASGVEGAGPRASIRSGGPLPSGHPKSVRPDANALDPNIPLFLIGKSKDGFWVAREENGRAGGTFFTERGARHFAQRWASPRGCASVAVSDPIELESRDDGNVLISLIRDLKSKGANRIPEPVLDVITIVLGLAAMALAVWLVIAFLTFGA